MLDPVDRINGPFITTQPVGLDYSLFGRGGGELLSASFARNTTLGLLSGYKGKHARVGVEDPGFDYQAYLLHDAPYSDRDLDLLEDSRNLDEFTLRHIAIMQTKRQIGVSANAGLFSNLGADLSTALVDPVSYIPFGGAASAGARALGGGVVRSMGLMATREVAESAARRGLVRGAASAVGRSYADALGAEAILYAMDDERTIESLVIDTTAGAIFQMGIGAAGRYMTAEGRQSAAKTFTSTLAKAEYATKKVSESRLSPARAVAYLQSKSGIRAKVNDHVRTSPVGADIPVRYGRIDRRLGGGREVAALETRPDGSMSLLVDTAALKKTFEEKAWTRPAVDGVTPMHESAFQSMDEWAAFLVEHELVHAELRTTPGRFEQLGLSDLPDADIENAINRIAYDRTVEKRSEFDHLPFAAGKEPENAIPGEVLFADDIDAKVEADLLNNANIGAGRKVLEKSFGVDWVARLASPALRVATANSSVARSVVEQLLPTPWVTRARQSGITGGPSVHARAKRWYGKMVVAESNHIRQFKDMNRRLKKEGKPTMSRPDFNELVTKNMRSIGDIGLHPPEVAASARFWRNEFYTPIGQEAVNVGMITPEEFAGNENFVHRLYDKVLLSEDRQGFVDTLAAYYTSTGMDREAALTSAGATYNKIISEPDGGESPTWKARRSSTLERLLDVPDSVIEPWLVGDIEKISYNYAKIYGVDIELHRAFGDVTMDAVFRDIEADYDRLVGEAGDRFKRTGDEKYKTLASKLNEERKSVYNSLIFFRDDLRSMANLPEDHSSIASRIPAVLRNAASAAYSGLFAIANLPDVATPIGVYGANDVFGHAWKPFVKQLKGGAARLSKENAQLVGQAAEMMNTHVIAEMTNSQATFGNIPHRRHSLSRAQRIFGNIEHGAAKSAEWASKLSLLAPLVDTIHEANSLVINHKIMEAAFAVADGSPIDPKTVELMARHGLNKQSLAKIGKAADGLVHREGDTIIPMLNRWDDDEALGLFLGASAQAADALNNVAGPGDKPLFFQGQMLRSDGQPASPHYFDAHTQAEIGKMQTMFMSYGFASMTRVVLTRMQQRDWPVLQGFIASMGMGAIAYAMRQIVTGNEITDDPAKFAAEAFDKSGMSGWYMSADRLLLGFASGGKVGVNAYLDNPATRWTPQAAFGHIAGAPGAWAYNVASSSLGIATSVMPGGPTTRGQAKNLWRQLPFNNLFYLRAVLEAAGSTGAMDSAQPQEHSFR